MKSSPLNASRSKPETRTGEQGSGRIILLGLACFLLGLAAGAFWFRGAASPGAENVKPQVSSDARVEQSEGTKAVLKPLEAQPPSKAPVTAAQISPADTEAIKRLIPNLDAVSVQEGTRILRQAALKEFKTAAEEMGGQVNEAQQRLSQAQNGQSEAGQQAAMKHLQEVQATQVEKLKQIAAQLQAQITALEQLKRQ